ncbi:N,N'-diacetylchitobiose phosphorylase [Oxobacter pfennigii]|uniref:N,N'-diacetylchitobiose phosphorylase n=1 Tax=Oxobacter pfennigii TaxID=36849 RepID=A0A0P9AI55_9CLOT|nr:glucoamylase family protein [Oxobacter pfennigii]KPU45143.1 N,N'-diacetylchitobiose phosphorylase [Oxobacter pfennigii]
MLLIILIVLFIIVIAVLAVNLYNCMKVKNDTIPHTWAAILNIEELEKHSMEIALSHAVSSKTKSSKRLIPRLNENFEYIAKTYKELNSEVSKRRPVAPAAEWLFDNFYVIEEQVKEIRLSFPKGYYAALPSILNGEHKGYPRVYSLAFEVVSHTDGRIDERLLINFLKAYQSKSQLTSGELWAVPIMLRVALIEFIRNLCEEILKSQGEKSLADDLADSILRDNVDINTVAAEINSITKDMEFMSHSFAERLLVRIRRHSGETGAIMALIDDKLASKDTKSSEVIAIEHQEQAKRQISIGNTITSLRLISNLGWNNIFEKLSPVEQILEEDPAGVYSRMDFESRDCYRHEIELMAKDLRISESMVAQKALDCALSAPEDDDKRINHVGYYILGSGRKKLEEIVGYKPGPWKKFIKLLKLYPTLIYLWSVSILTLIISFTLAFANYKAADGQSAAVLILCALAALLPASELGVGIVNWVVTHILTPSFLPKLELKEGIPENCTAMVVVPTLLPNKIRVKELFGQLEVYYLANQDKNLYFGILGDFTDAKEKEMPGDEDIIKTALEEVYRLNQKYAADNDIFYFFHRYRKFNPAEGKWMGWERKRGKLMEFNELLRGAQDTTYHVKSNDLSEIPPVKYVITLDADTELPRGAAKKLIGTLSHPLNRAVVDENQKRVLEGYGILQPRINVSVLNANKSLFSRIFAGKGGIDPYTNAISDVYQDLFGEGIFTGKGIYDVDIFQSMLKGYIPENAVLSHDLLEGSYIRAGLVTDIELIDGFPSKYNSYAARMHRWVRGDWQLLPWLMPKVKDVKGEYVKNPLSAISRWKIFDNLRRSLISPAQVILIFLTFTVLPGLKSLWTGFAILTIALPILCGMADAVIARTRTKSLSSRTAFDFKSIFIQTLLTLIFMPYRAYLMLDAVIRTIVRLLVTKRNLLEWETAADAEARLKCDTKSFFTRMWAAPVIAVLLLISVLTVSPVNLSGTLVFVILWVASPTIAQFISLADDHKKPLLNKDDIYELRRLSRKTWRYFEDFAGQAENYLPPDNYQEEPDRGAAHRTSPTNMGLLLASILCARDLGYISTKEMLEKTENTFKSLEKLDTWKGHFYNWYDTKTLQPLRPLYVSTVDSGNFVGCLMVLKEGLKEYLKRPLIDAAFIDGIFDTLELLKDDLGYEDEVISLMSYFKGAAGSPAGWFKALTDFKNKKSEIERALNLGNSPWNYKVDSMIASLEDELMDAMPWVKLTETMSCALRGSENKIRIKVNDVIDKIAKDTSPAGLCKNYRLVMADINSIMGEAKEPEASKWLREFKDSVMKAYLNCNKILSTGKILWEAAEKMTAGCDFKPLFDEGRQLFAIGYSIEEEQLNKSYYDLLASEARQTSFIAIAKGDVPERHWFRLGRQLTLLDGTKGLVSWSGTMFEYLMPLLFMKNYKNTLMDETYNFVVAGQKEYGNLRRVPWGVSECGYYGFDASLNYQYKAFGVPKLGLKRGLINDIVIAPYATILALMVDPVSAMKNIRELKKEDLMGAYGFYEAIDYTPGRVPVDKKGAIVRSFMVHHHGMSLISLNNFLKDNIMQERFHRDPKIKATELLLQEKMPGRIVLTKDVEDEIYPVGKIAKPVEDYAKVIKEPVLPFPDAHIISNGAYSVIVSNSGTGLSRKEDTVITRWREDSVLDTYGMFFYIQNINSNNVWSAAYEPYKVMPEEYRVVFSADKVEFQRVDGSIDTHMEISVSPEDNAEIRRISLTNHSDHARVIEVTSYFEVVLSRQSADTAHTAFNKLFVRTEYVDKYNSLLATRRPRSLEEKPVWLVHTVAVEGETIGPVQYETDRLKFLGRNRDLSNPAAMDVDHPLLNSIGPVIDPIMSLRRRVRIKRGETVKLVYTTGIAASREGVMELAGKYSEMPASNRAYELAWTKSQMESGFLNLRNSEVETYQKMVAHLLYVSPLRRTREDVLKKNVKGQSGLWPHGISGDVPVLLVALSKIDEIDVVQEALKAHEFLRHKGFAVDLVILNEDAGSYIQTLQRHLEDVVAASHGRDMQNRPGGVFLRQANTMEPEERVLLYTAARIVLKGELGSIAKQLRLKHIENAVPAIEDVNRPRKSYPPFKETVNGLVFNNSLGGFKKDGSEYVIQINEDTNTPAPWSNVISNEGFGCIVTESGSGYTFAENSREYKITPWYNDPVADPPGEVLYIKDAEDLDVWSVTANPIREKEPYVVRHGFGYTVYSHVSHGIKQEMTVFVPKSGKIKIMHVKLKNISDRPRSLRVCYYMRPVLGVTDQITAPYIVSEVDEGTGALLLRNTYSDDFAGRYVCIDTSAIERNVTGDRAEFIGRGKSLECPVGLYRNNLSGKVGAGFDPCGAMEISLILEEDEEKELVFTLSQGVNREEALNTSLRYRDLSEVKSAFDEVKAMWVKKLQTIQVSTPDNSLNIMVNGWLMYQTIASRFWARSAFYQSGGAYGFRDQLQDAMAISFVSPESTRGHILYSAAHQFLEGDVQHWWHPVTDRGIRTRFSDDLLWLPYVTADYISVTGDYSILDETAPFLEDEPLDEKEDERYNKPRVSGQAGTIYDHCLRAIDRSLKFGEHGIPLMGSGDWNDGMSTVGNKGRGESVWLGWFLYKILNNFAPICRRKGDNDKADSFIETAKTIVNNIEKNAWDGSWYRRAYFDDGTPLGSASNSECKIDSLAQSWSVISEGGKEYRSIEAMGALEQYLVKRDEGLIMLLTPSFDKSELEPGYIKAYVPGVRENGGQYTHAAVWVVLAFAMLGNGNKAWELFNMINPINHSTTALDTARYKAEPYVMAADVYAVEPHVGRGGWTWYTGASGWMYRVCIEHILGLKIRGDKLMIDPCIPKEWGEYSMKYNYQDTQYIITVKNPYGTNHGVKKVYLDGGVVEDNIIPLTNDNRDHHIDVLM